MPPLPGFSDNPFKSRSDILRAVTSLLQPLEQYKSSCGARIKLATATGTGFDEISAQLEGFARPLWVVPDLLLLGEKSAISGISSLNLESWINGLYSGVDPESPTYWGNLGDFDQRMVEMEPIAYALLSVPSIFFPTSRSPTSAQNLITWLRSINGRKMPPSNWRWFRVLTNLALVKVCGIPYSELKPAIDSDLDLLDTSYIGGGWSSDGVWTEDRKQADYYSGSFAMQYSQLAFVRSASDLEPERCEKYRRQAVDFASRFWRYFDPNGAAIPFGRSLTYRFAFAAFWSALLTSDITLPDHLSLGIVKGLLLRHLRWWAAMSHIFNTDGTLNIGYTYPNMYMSEDYNSPQSVYWCLKTFSFISLPEEHPFWSCEEMPHPLFPAAERETSTSCPSEKLKRIEVIAPPLQIICSTQVHHFLLSAGQFTKKPHKAREAKYSKFAYSSSFSFSVPTCHSCLEQLAPDSTLTVSNDNGESWKVRYEPIDARIENLCLRIGEEEVEMPVLKSKWQPWKKEHFVIETILIPPLKGWDGWHIRAHRIHGGVSNRQIHCVDAGFAIRSQSNIGGNLPAIPQDLKNASLGQLAVEGYWKGDLECLIISSAGASGVADLTSVFLGADHVGTNRGTKGGEGVILNPDANTNLSEQRTLIPTVQWNLDSLEGRDSEKQWFITGIFAVSSSSGIQTEGVKRMWQDRPKFGFSW